MFSLRRKIGTGATTRRRPSRECKVGIECLDTRAVPALIIPTPGSPLLESGTGTLGTNVLNVAFDEHGHASAQITVLNPFTNTSTTSSRLLVSNLNAAGVPQPIPGVDFGTTTTTTTRTILVFGQSSPATEGIVAAQPSPGVTTLSTTPNGIAVTITSIDASGVPVNTPAFFNLQNVRNSGPATGPDAMGHISQNFQGSFTVTSNRDGTGTNYLSGTFSDTVFGTAGTGTSATLSVASPVSPSLSFTSGVIQGLDQPRAMSLAFTNVSNLSVVGTGANATIGPFTSNVAGNFSATGTVTITTPTLAYKLPTPVADGDVAVYNFQTGQLSDLIRFQTVSDPVAGTTSWMLIYSDADPADAPADVGVPTPTHSVLTQSVVEFGVEGYSTIEYAAEQATYSGLSDFNAVPLGSA